MQKYEALKIPNLSDIISFMLNSINTVLILRNIPLPVASLTMDISVVWPNNTSQLISSFADSWFYH